MWHPQSFISIYEKPLYVNHFRIWFNKTLLEKDQRKKEKKKKPSERKNSMTLFKCH